MPRSPWVLLVPKAGMSVIPCLLPAAWVLDLGCIPQTTINLFLSFVRGSCMYMPYVILPEGEAYSAFHKPLPVAPRCMAEAPQVLHACSAQCSRDFSRCSVEATWGLQKQGWNYLSTLPFTSVHPTSPGSQPSV